MELRQNPVTNRTRLVCAAGAIVVVLAAAVVLAGHAQADRDSSRGGEGRPDPAWNGRPDRQPAARANLAQRPPAENAKALAQVRDTAGEPLPLTDEACRGNVARAASQGLRLPSGWEMHCVGPGLDWEGGSHWGVTCPYAECPEGSGPYVSISNPTYYVVAHELCHANFGNDELMADNCAAEHGASLASSPYR